MRCFAPSGLPSYCSRSQGLRPGLSCVAPLGFGAVAHVLQMNIFHVQWCIRGCMRNSYENSSFLHGCRGDLLVAPTKIFIRSGEPQDHGNLVASTDSPHPPPGQMRPRIWPKGQDSVGGQRYHLLTMISGHPALIQIFDPTATATA